MKFLLLQRTGKGMNVVNLLPLEKDETVSAMVKIPAEENRKYLCMVTKRVLSRERISTNISISARAVLLQLILMRAMSLLMLKLLTDRKLVVATHDGMSICFDEADARLIGRTARGVRNNFTC